MIHSCYRKRLHSIQVRRLAKLIFMMYPRTGLGIGADTSLRLNQHEIQRHSLNINVHRVTEWVGFLSNEQNIETSIRFRSSSNLILQ